MLPRDAAYHCVGSLRPSLQRHTQTDVSAGGQEQGFLGFHEVMGCSNCEYLNICATPWGGWLLARSEQIEGGRHHPHRLPPSAKSVTRALSPTPRKKRNAPPTQTMARSRPCPSHRAFPAALSALSAAAARRTVQKRLGSAAIPARNP